MKTSYSTSPNVSSTTRTPRSAYPPTSGTKNTARRRYIFRDLAKHSFRNGNTHASHAADNPTCKEVAMPADEMTNTTSNRHPYREGTTAKGIMEDGTKLFGSAIASH